MLLDYCKMYVLIIIFHGYFNSAAAASKELYLNYPNFNSILVSLNTYARFSTFPKRKCPQSSSLAPKSPSLNSHHPRVMINQPESQPARRRHHRSHALADEEVSPARENSFKCGEWGVPLILLIRALVRAQAL